MAQQEGRRRHLRIEQFHSAKDYKSKKRGNSPFTPFRSNPARHGKAIEQQLQSVTTGYQILAQSWEGNEAIKARGICVELESAPNTQIPTERLLANGWELLNERPVLSGQTVQNNQTWFVPDGKLDVLSEIVDSYLTKTRKDKAKVDQPLYRPFVEAIERVHTAALNELWTEADPFPQNHDLWLEIWLRRGVSENERDAILNQFILLAEQSGLRVGKGRIKLPEHTILAVYGKGSDLAKDLATLNCIAEIRRGRDYADVFSGMLPSEQIVWSDDLLVRIEDVHPDAPWVSVLDTGVNRGHPMLQRHIGEDDNMTIEQSWSAGDDDNHGTLMAGLCLYGDLAEILSGTQHVTMPVNVEGVKIVPPPAQRESDEKLAGYYTAQGVYLAEAKQRGRRRTWCITTTMAEPNTAIPSSWSAQMDNLAAGVDNEGELRRLLCLSAGNIPQDLWKDYPESNYLHTIRNPGQSWNALCVGAYTELQTIRNETSYVPLALRGALAPVSSTSLKWEDNWPNKPDIVFEGGNAGFQEANQSTLSLDELMLLSTHAQFNEGVFGTTSGTSPATALAARMAGTLMAEYPEYSPETIRGLMIHSADWTEAMKASIPQNIRGRKSDSAAFLLRTVGYGVPNLRRAIECSRSSATLIAECQIQPFKIDDGETLFNEMHLHSLPWPTNTLSAHSTERVRMRVTLSYFIEPNPGNRGYTSQFRYASSALRFKVSSPGQSAEDLAADVNRISSEELANDEKRHVKGSLDGWLLGEKCFKGSIHSDIWEGSAADLLSMKHIAVTPITGWWRTRSSHDRAEAKLNYSLIVSIECANEEIEIYNEIENWIAIELEF